MTDETTERIHILTSGPYAGTTRCGLNHAQNMYVSAISPDPIKIRQYEARTDCHICPECKAQERGTKVIPETRSTAIIRDYLAGRLSSWETYLAIKANA